jgi:hypothetical protein
MTGENGITFRGHPGSHSFRRDVFEISRQSVSKEIALMITNRKDAKMMGAADVNKHTRNHWESRARAAMSMDSLSRGSQPGMGQNRPPSPRITHNLAVSLCG